MLKMAICLKPTNFFREGDKVYYYSDQKNSYRVTKSELDLMYVVFNKEMFDEFFSPLDFTDKELEHLIQLNKNKDKDKEFEHFKNSIEEINEKIENLSLLLMKLRSEASESKFVSTDEVVDRMVDILEDLVLFENGVIN